ncbi:MAG: ECF-type sigma factor [Acidobacteriota bacterium]
MRRTTKNPGDLTRLLASWDGAGREEMSSLWPQILEELRPSARSLMRRERSDHTLQPTALIHEALLRLLPKQDTPWRNRQHFFAVATLMMKRTLWDHARARAADKRCAGAEHFKVGERDLRGKTPPAGFDSGREALRELTLLNPRRARIVEMHVFGGLNKSEIAHELGLSRMTIHREWTRARAWLFKRLSRSPGA